MTARRLRAAGIERLVDVRTAPDEMLREAVGSYAPTLRDLSMGIDERPVEPDRERKSVGSEETYPQDLSDAVTIRSEIADRAGECAEYLDRHGLFARTVTLKLRYSNFQTITRSETRRPATRSAAEIAARAAALLEKTEAGKRPVRLIGVSVHGLEKEREGQMGLMEIES